MISCIIYIYIYILLRNFLSDWALILSHSINVEQTWQNSSNINSRIELKILINSIRSNINSRIGFEHLFETQFYDQIKQIDYDEMKINQELNSFILFLIQLFNEHKIKWWYINIYMINLTSCFYYLDIR